VVRLRTSQAWMAVPFKFQLLRVFLPPRLKLSSSEQVTVMPDYKI